MDNPLTDSEDIVRKYLQDKYTITDESFTVSEFEAQEGEQYLIQVRRKELVEIIKGIPMSKHSYIGVSGKDYREWKKIYSRKYKLLKIKSNVKII